MSDDLAELTRDPKTDRATNPGAESDAGDDPLVDGAAPPDRGLLDWKPGKLAKHLRKLWRSLDASMQPRIIRWKVNAARRGGRVYVGMVKDQDTSTYRLYTPPDSARVPPSLGRAPRLCRRITAQMFQDPPLPEAVPSRDDDEARDASEVTTRILGQLDSESGTNGLSTARRAFDRFHSYGSGFRYHWVDPKGGGRAPATVLASMQATTEEDAVERHETVPGINGPVDRIIAQPEPYVARYIRKDGSLTDDQSEAMEEWLPKLCHEVHTGRTFRMWPATAQDISQARLGLLMSLRSWADVKLSWPEVEQLSDDAQKEIVKFRPEGAKDLLPSHLTEKDLDGTERSDGKLADDALCFILIAYAKAGAEAPDGLYAVVGGKSTMIHVQDWRYVNDETGISEPMDIPVDQFKGYEEGDDDPYGYGSMDRLGDGDELLASVDAARITHFQRLGSRKTFLPMTSSLTPRSLQAGTATVMPYSGGKPEYEEIPPFPPDTIELRQQIADEMTDESGLQPAAQGQAEPSVQSGFHAVQMIEQSLAGMSDIRQNSAQLGLERGWRIDVQLIRAFYTGVHILRMVGPDGSVKVEHWTASDLGDTNDVRLLRGTYSMMSPSMKSSIALAMSQQGLLSKEGLTRATEGNTGGILALQDDPHIMRVRRQVEAWKNGPGTLPDGSPDPTTPSPFDYRPVDDQPDVAPLRATEIGRAMASPKYGRKPLGWQQLLNIEYQRAVAASQGQPQPPPGPTNATDPGGALPPGATAGATPQTPPIVGQPAVPGTPPDAAIAGLHQPPPAQSPVIEAGDPRFAGSALPAPAATIPQ